MTRLLLLAFLALASASACSSGRTVSPAADGGPIGAAPATERCAGAKSACLWGTAAAHGFQLPPRGLEVELYAVFPSSGSSPVATTPVALDGTWAMSGLAAGSHYYAQLLADFGQPHSIAALFGALSVPASGPAALAVEPVQVQLLEDFSAGVGSLGWVEGHAYDPSTGAELMGTAGFTINLTGAPTTVPWGKDGAGFPAYYLTFPTGTPAEASYSGFVTGPGPESKPSMTWRLVAAPPTFMPALGAPSEGATIAVGQPLAVSWAALPTADFLLVQLFVLQSSTWQPVYASPKPESPTTTSEVIPAADIAAAGSYLLDLDVSTASCPLGASGCVLASAVADAQLTAQ